MSKVTVKVESTPLKHPFRSSQSLMVQGTTSDAGKSAFVTALCRLFSNRGQQVAPFKPQNMALNSAVTEDNGEIGRAQAVQAQAARVRPIVAFNPILLKPNSDTGSQVILNGHAIGHFSATEYQKLKPELLKDVIQQHDALSKNYEHVLIEGAGSPAEINLRENDIANMGFAEAIDCPVVLISDIDRGGVFAHLVGTFELLSESEQARMCGFIINRFRGDISLLEPGIQWLEQRTGKPVLAVLPYLEDFHLEAEDGLSRGKNTAHGNFHVAVIALPRMSNHTDFDPLRLHPEVSLDFLRHPNDLTKADLIILPGTKHTRADLDWLKAQGWPEAIQRHLRYGGKVIGICGGYQMLGTRIDDPMGIEGQSGSSDGLGWLPITTTMEEKKQLRRVSGSCLLKSQSDMPSRITGYEIHMGESEIGAECNTVFHLDDQREEGKESQDHQVLGTYLHGLFDHPDALRILLEWAGLEGSVPFDYRQETDHQIDRLAASVQQSLRPACKKVPVLAELIV